LKRLQNLPVISAFRTNSSSLSHTDLTNLKAAMSYNTRCFVAVDPKIEDENNPATSRQGELEGPCTLTTQENNQAAQGFDKPPQHS
jgi:hypothetical protein